MRQAWPSTRPGYRSAAARVIRSARGWRCWTRCARRGPGSGLVRQLTAAPDLDGWAIIERLLTGPALLRDQLWLVMDDLHELDSDQARRQLELLVMRAPAKLRFVMATPEHARLGLHRLRLEGELTEIRADDLRFTVAEAQALFQAAGLELPGPTM